MEAFMSFFKDFFTCCQAKLHFVTASSNLKAAFLLVRGSHPTCGQGATKMVRIAFQVFKKILDQRMYVYWFIKSPICLKKTHLRFWKVLKGPKNKLLHFIEISKSPCRIPYLLLELRCKFAHQALIHVTTPYSVRGFAQHTELATDEFYDAHGEDGVAHGAKPPVDGGAKMGEDVVFTHHWTITIYHYSLWLLGWPHLVVSLMA